MKAIKFNKYLYNKLDNLQQVLHLFYNTIQNRLINLQLLNEILSYQHTKQPPFSKAEFINAINNYSNSTLGLDYILQSYLKAFIGNAKYVANIVNMANSCINLSHQPSYFKKSRSIIIPKSNKPSYNSLKIFQPIVLFNILEKLIKKVLSNRLQIHSITLNFIHLNQMGSIKQQSTTNTGIFLTYLIQAEQLKSLYISTLVFNITQFFLFLNHQLLVKILSKVSFDS